MLIRNPQRIKDKIWYDKVDVFKGDVLDENSITGLFEGVDIAYYLIHSMEANGDFVKSDLIAANNFAKVADKENLENIIYLGGLADENSELSEHLKSRHDTG